MAITVKHKFVSAIPDGDDSSLVKPSNWNDTHELTGLGTMAEQNANAVAITGGTISGVTIPASNLTGTVDVPHGGTGATTLTGYVKGTGTTAMTASGTIPNTDITGLGTMSTQNANNVAITGGTMSGVAITGYIPTTEKGVANGVATLDSSAKVPISQIPDSVIGALSYQGTWNASTNTPTLTSSVGTKGYYYVVSVAGSTDLNGITDWKVGDWAVYSGTAWQKIDNTDSVTSVNGYTGAVVLTNTDISGFGTMSTQNANSVAITGGAIDGTTIGATTATTGKFTTVNASTSLTTPTVQASNSGGLSLKNSAGTTQMSMGAGGGDNMSINVSTNLNGTNAQIDISPTGTGHVHINPTGTNSVQVNPTSVGTIDNMTIGATTAVAGSFTNLSVTGTTKFDGAEGTAGQVLTSAGTGNTPTWTTPTTGTVTSVAATAGTGISVSGSPITSSGTLTITNTAPDQTVAIASGTGISVTGTYPNFTVTNTSPSSGGTVTSVTATSPVTSTGGTTPVIAMPAATTSVNGYLTSTDWNTFNNKGSGTVTAVSVTSANGFAGTSSGGATPALTLSTSISGVLKGNGTAISAATSGTDYSAGTSALSTGILKSTTTTGALTIAVAADFPTLNQNTTGTASNVTGTVAIANGGTGQTTAAAAFNALNPMTTTGDIIYESAAATAARLAIGSTGQVLTVASGIPSWATPASSGGISWQTVQTANFTATASYGYPVNTTSSAITVTLPASPSAGNIVYFLDYAGTWDINNVTVNPNGLKINGSTINVLLKLNREGIAFVYIDSTQGWIPYSGINAATPELTNYSVEYLVVAGGGAGGGNAGGGGGAGGYRASTATVTIATGYTVTVGAGGSGGTGNGANGGNSVFSTITSTGGGGGGGLQTDTASARAGASGGSGGGGGGTGNDNVGVASGGSGTSGQGNSGGSSGTSPSSCIRDGGGGGGSTGAGGAASGQSAGGGGIGTVWSNGGSYAGGGGGGNTNYTAYSCGADQPGGAGNSGGGNGGSAANGSSATTNTGSGGGGGGFSPSNAYSGGNGASGIVIVRYSGTQRGTGGTVSSSGGYTYHTFTSSGTYTA